MECRPWPESCTKFDKAVGLARPLLGVNLGKNKDTPNEQAASDYRKGMDCLHSFADYFTINLSSPNTPGLRQLQHGEALKALLSRVKSVSWDWPQSDPVPLMLKVAPDLADEEIEQIAEQASACEFDGVIATNTTLSREAVAGHKHAEEAGGLSGSPLTGRSLSVVSNFDESYPRTWQSWVWGGLAMTTMPEPC